MAAAALKLRTPISALRETARRSLWVRHADTEAPSPVAELWARIEREYAQAPRPGTASND